MAIRTFRRAIGARIPARYFSGSMTRLNDSVSFQNNQENDPETIIDNQSGRPLIPSALKRVQAAEPTAFKIPSRLEFTKVRSPELERLRVVPTESTFFGGNPVHDANINYLNRVLRKNIDLPTVAGDITTTGRKFISFEEYKEQSNSGTRLKPIHHRELVSILNRLKAIDPQLTPADVTEALNKFTKAQSIESKKAKKLPALDEFGRAVVKGRRKTSKANVYLTKGEGLFLINGKLLLEYFPRMNERIRLNHPFAVVAQEGQYNVFAEVVGGGISGQCEAIMYGIAKGLTIHNPLLKSRLHAAGLITRDTRIVERKKPGHRKARKMPQWVKR